MMILNEISVLGRIGAAGLLLACSLISATLADDDIDTVVVTASRLAHGITDSSKSVSILDQEDIENRMLVNTTELLRQMAGVNVIQQGARGGVTSVVLRGGEPNFTVVLIDGVKINDSTNTRGGSYDFSYLDTDNIERVEIVRGPMSAIYGSDALAGVINIITRSAQKGVRLQAELGGHGLRSAHLSGGGTIGALNSSLSLHATEEDGDIEGAGYEDWGADANLLLDLTSGGSAGLLLRFQDANSTSFPEDSGGPELAVIREADRRDVRETHGRLFIERGLGDDWAIDASISSYERSEDAVSSGIAPGVFDGVPPNSADTDFSRETLLLSAERTLSDSARILLGAEWQQEEGDSRGVLDLGFELPTDFRLRRDTVSAFAEFEWALPALTLQGSARWDDPERIDDELSAQLGATVPLPADAGTLRANWGQAFKAPSFFALAHPLVGNPDLRAETATGIDIGYRRDLGPNSAIELSVYRNEFEDLIDFDPVLFTNVNRSQVVTKGAELSGYFALNASLEADFHVSYADSEIRDSDARLRGRPRWRGGVVLNWRINERFALTTSLLRVDEFFEVAIPTGGLFLDGYTRVDLALSIKASDKLRLGLAIDNALNEEYAEAVGFPAAGLRTRVRASYEF